jgi:hypothetical protein
LVLYCQKLKNFPDVELCTVLNLKFLKTARQPTFRQNFDSCELLARHFVFADKVLNLKFDLVKLNLSHHYVLHIVREGGQYSSGVLRELLRDLVNPVLITVVYEDSRVLESEGKLARVQIFRIVEPFLVRDYNLVLAAGWQGMLAISCRDDNSRLSRGNQLGRKVDKRQIRVVFL